MTHPLIVIASLWLFMWGWHKHGFRKTTLCACLIVMSIFPFAFAGMLLPSIFGFFGVPEISMPVRIAAGVVAIVGAMIAAKYLGCGKVLAGIFMAAMAVSTVAIIGLLFLMLGIAVHATVEGLIFIVALTFILVAFGHGFRARGH